MYIKNLQKYERGVLFMLLGALSVTLFGFFVKIEVQNFPFTFLVFLRFFLPLLLVTPFCFFWGTFRRLKSSGINYPAHFMRAIFVLISQYSLFYYLNHTTLLNGMMLWNSAPIFTPLICKVFFGHRHKKIIWLSVIVGFFGLALILKPDVGIFDPMSIWGLMAGFFTAASQTLYGNHRITCKVDVNVFLLFLFTSFSSFIVFILFEGILCDAINPDLLIVFTGGWAFYFPVCMVALGTIGNQIFRGMAYSYAQPGSLAPFVYVAALLSGVLDWLYFKHIPDFMFIIGILLVVFAAVIPIFFHRER